MARKVVLIDDEADLVLLLRTALEAKGFEVHSAGNGDAGLKLIDKINPDCVICDLMMPGTSGLEVCKRLRSNEKTKDLPLLVISALGAESDKPEEFWAAGLKSDDFISKPFEPAELLGRLEYVLRKQQYVSSGAKGKEPKEGDIAAHEGKAAPVDLKEAAPKIIVRSFIESWNTMDFETEYQCMSKALTGGLGLNEYIGRRRQVGAQDSARKQFFQNVVSQRRTADESVIVCERKDVSGKMERLSKEEYTLKKSPEGWKIVSVRKAP
jgi:CheY-like chemotaxis protein